MKLTCQYSIDSISDMNTWWNLLLECIQLVCRKCQLRQYLDTSKDTDGTSTSGSMGPHSGDRVSEGTELQAR